jgi:hypothetical protein
MDTIKTILSFLLGGSKTPLILLSSLFLLVGGYLFYTVNSLQSNLRTQELNNEIMKSNVEKLEKAKEEQDKAIETYKQLFETSSQSYQETILLLQRQTLQNQQFIKKLSQINSINIQKNPNKFENDVNISFQLINVCYEKLSEVNLKGNGNVQIIECSPSSLPDFSN